MSDVESWKWIQSKEEKSSPVDVRYQSRALLSKSNKRMLAHAKAIFYTKCDNQEPDWATFTHCLLFYCFCKKKRISIKLYDKHMTIHIFEKKVLEHVRQEHKTRKPEQQREVNNMEMRRDKNKIKKLFQ